MTTVRSSASASNFAVRSTLVLFNNTLVQGNFPATSGLGPAFAACDALKGEVFVSNAISNSVAVFSDLTSSAGST